ncbi:hypothetical protein P170DRAFT_514091 [Aspergillus steynii IBT 23096]|uniref:DUF7924 domain-containing protein n=1 Tax=Aspergillus steynii IBT 23096 TaxID=1392250 RepID=A0A2I2FT21_9EURO|nr:uncharacterized protein P170DRAFT_514091 [Aspergillus steynii IBT 23096]PLB43766.1 hypothetical protein P170DRAFT_514091 [Aspergillus steynii IBT 23096]
MSCHQSLRHEPKIQKPAAYWDNLSTLYLTKGALQELQRRIGRPQKKRQSQRPSQTAAAILKKLKNRLEEVKRSSRQGGFDLTDLRGYPQPEIDSRCGPMTRTRPVPKSKRTRKISNDADDITSITTTPYSLNFEQHLTDHQVHPLRHSYGESQKGNKPENMLEIRNRLANRRASLSSLNFSDADFDRFSTACDTASKEPQVSASVLPFIQGNTSQYSGGGTLFNNVAPLTDGTISDAKPDIYYGVRPEELHRKIRNDLNDMIIPCTNDSLPILPNFIVEVKGLDGKTSVSKRQCCYYGALGARAVHALQSYQPDRAGEAVYDNNAYTITCSYYDGMLSLFAHHLKAPAIPGERPQYFMTQLRSFMILDSPESFRDGVSAYRNARDWTKEKRDEMVVVANRRLQEAGEGASGTEHENASSTSGKEGEEEGKEKREKEERKKGKREKMEKKEAKKMEKEERKKRKREKEEKKQRKEAKKRKKAE